MLVQDLKIINYEHKMCLYGKPKGLLAYHLTSTPEGYDYCYRDEGLQPLWSGEKGVMSDAVVRSLLSSFVEAVLACSEYLLDFNHVSLEGSGCWLDENHQVGYTFLPFELDLTTSLQERLNKWLEMIYKHVDVNSEATMSLLHPIGIALGAERLTLTTFVDAVKSSLRMDYV